MGVQSYQRCHPGHVGYMLVGWVYSYCGLLWPNTPLLLHPTFVPDLMQFSTSTLSQQSFRYRWYAPKSIHRTFSKCYTWGHHLHFSRKVLSKKTCLNWPGKPHSTYHVGSEIKETWHTLYNVWAWKIRYFSSHGCRLISCSYLIEIYVEVMPL